MSVVPGQQLGGLHTVSQKVKKYIVEASYSRDIFKPSLIVAYNQAADGWCSFSHIFDKRTIIQQRQDSSGPTIEIVVSSGTIIATDYPIPPCRVSSRPQGSSSTTAQEPTSSSKLSTHISSTHLSSMTTSTRPKSTTSAKSQSSSSSSSTSPSTKPTRTGTKSDNSTKSTSKIVKSTTKSTSNVSRSTSASHLALSTTTAAPAPLPKPSGYEKWNSGYCSNDGAQVALSTCQGLINSIQSDYAGGNSETYLCPSSTPGTPFFKTVGGCTLTIVSDTEGNCISTGDALLFLRSASFCSAKDSLFSARADISTGSICIDGSSDGSHCKRTPPKPSGYEKWNSGYCNNDGAQVALSTCQGLINSVQSDYAGGNSETYLCPPSTLNTPFFKTVGGCTLTIISDTQGNCISTGDALLFLQSTSFCSAKDSLFSARADISTASICIGGASDGSHCARAPPKLASCDRADAIIAIGFSVFSSGWITDGGAALKKQVEGCGLVTFWRFGAVSGKQVDGSSANLGSYTAQFEATFDLPITFKSGCVGRAIKSAGGPDGVRC